MRRWRWGFGWGLGWATLFNLAASSPMFYQMESLALQSGLRLRGSQPPDPAVVVVGIDGRVDGQQQQVDFLLERANYAALTQRLIEAGAGVVVLNLPSSFVTPQRLGNEDLDASLRQLLALYPERIVLATRSSQSFRQWEFPIYNHFLTYLPDSFDPLVPPEFVQGFVQSRLDDADVLRYAQVRESFLRRDSQQAQVFAGVEALALLKFRPTQAVQLFRQGALPFFFNPLGTNSGIPLIPIEQICLPRFADPCLAPLTAVQVAEIKNKVVLVGFVGGYPETFPVKIATGDVISAVMVQAQVISSLLQGTFYRQLPRWGGVLVLTMMGVSTGLLTMKRWSQAKTVGMLLIVAGGYTSWVMVQLLWLGWVWPLVLPWLVGSLTVGSSALTRVLLYSRERLQAQQAELEGLRRAEQEAIIDQARKLLYRVATDIHDQELQELKLAMDSLEGWQWQQSQGKAISADAYDHLLENLQHIGQGIRDQLNDVRTLADKLRISPSLKDGLHNGITSYLAECQDSGSLSLPLMTDIQPLQESNSREWLDAREDIIRFIREAINNVIHHVQPPRGTATFVQVSLHQLDCRCTVRVVNDGVPTQPRRRGGYGTKAMNTIARDLPGGAWQRVHLENGWVEVTLAWDMPEG